VRVLLRTSVKGLGRRGDIVDASDGYARNYLLPYGHAVLASDKVTAQAEQMRRSRDLREARDREGAELLASRISAASIKVTVRAGAGGRLFGSVTASDIARAVQEQIGAEVDRRKIRLDDPIKALGTHQVEAALHQDVTTVLTVEVVEEGA